MLDHLLNDNKTYFAPETNARCYLCGECDEDKLTVIKIPPYHEPKIICGVCNGDDEEVLDTATDVIWKAVEDFSNGVRK